MSPRLIGAVLALIAAVLLAVSMAASAMWAGHPSVDGRPIEKKTVYIGLLGGQGCNTGGDGSCEDLSLSTPFTVASFVQLGTSSLFVLVALLLALTSFKSAASRRSIAKGAIGVALICVAVVLAQIVIGPHIKSAHEVKVPIGYGMFLFLGAIIAVVVAGLLAPKEDPPVTLRPSRQPILAAPPAQQPQIDVLALLQQDDARPAPPSPGGMLPGPAGPLGAGSSPANPSFHNPPGLRPLYDADAAQGGTHGFVPSAAPPLPMQPPPPIPRAEISARVGIPTPPPMSLPGLRADTSLDPVAPPPPPAAAPTPSARAKAASVAPPPRVKSPSIPPPAKGAPAKKLPAPGFTTKGPATSLGMAVPAPPVYMLPVTGQAEPSEEVATRAINKEPDLMVGSPMSVGDSTDADKKLPAEERTDVNAVPVTDDGEEMATVLRDPKPNAKPEHEDEAATVARPKQDPEDLVTDPVQARASAKSLPKIPISTASESLPPPKEEKAAHGGPQPACPQCEAPMGWVEEHLRFYCKSCRMYF